VNQHVFEALCGLGGILLGAVIVGMPMWIDMLRELYAWIKRPR
jgi:hypothetical protein